MTYPMTIEQFAERLDALGPDFSRWPADQAEAAEALLPRSSDARALHADARALSRLVAEAAEAEAPLGFAFRVVAEVSSRKSDRLLWLTGSPGRLGLAGMSFCVAALAIGATLGAVTSPAQAGVSELDLGAAFAVSFNTGGY